MRALNFEIFLNFQQALSQILTIQFVVIIVYSLRF